MFVSLPLFLLLGIAPQAEAPVPPEAFPEIVAKINGVALTKEALIRRAEALRSQLPSFEVGADFYERVLSEMVGSELLFQAAEARGLVPADAQVDEEIAAQTKRFGGKEAFASALESQGLTLSQVRSELVKEMAVQSFVDEELASRVAVSEEAKMAFYAENAQDMRRPMQFRAAHILIGVAEDAPPERKDEARKKAAGIRSMLDVGQDFAELARRNSDDPGSKNNGGELPWMSQGQTVPPFEQAALALEAGQMSDVVETQFGFHIIRLLERRDAGALPYDEVAPRIEEFLMQRGLQELIESEIDKLGTNGQVELFI